MKPPVCGNCGERSQETWEFANRYSEDDRLGVEKGIAHVPPSVIVCYHCIEVAMSRLNSGMRHKLWKVLNDQARR